MFSTDLDGVFGEFSEARIKSDATVNRARFELPDGTKRPLVIFGTGILARKIRLTAQAAEFAVVAFCDNDSARWGDKVDGTHIIAPSEAVQRYGETATFVVAIYNPKIVFAQLKGLECRSAATFPMFFREYGEHFRGISGLAQSQHLVENEANIRASYALLDDAASRREYVSQLRWRFSLDDQVLDTPRPFADMHFDPEVYTISEHESLVDCGAFDGDSLAAFFARTQHKFAHAFALEPDPANRAKLGTFVSSLPAGLGSCVTILPFAAGDRNETIRFDAGFGVDSHESHAGKIEVACRRLDDVIDRPTTLIKMDIEGAELSALLGTGRIILEDRPVLTICAYHYDEHLWEIPRLLRKLSPDSRIYLRRYAQQCWETVYYAVPPERCAM